MFREGGLKRKKWMNVVCSCNNNTNNINNIWSRFLFMIVVLSSVPTLFRIWFVCLCVFLSNHFYITVWFDSSYRRKLSNRVIYYRFRVSPTCRLLSDKCVCDRLDNYSATTPNNSHLAAGPSQSLMRSSHLISFRDVYCCLNSTVKLDQSAQYISRFVSNESKYTSISPQPSL